MPAFIRRPDQTMVEALTSHQSLLTVAEAATIISIAAPTLYKWAAAAKIPAIMLGSAVRFDPKELANWLSRRSVAA